MQQFQVTSRSVRSQIKNLLHDSYRGGFSILKELVQNADDAEASHLRVVHLNAGAGEGAKGHPLLNSPALLAINDGPFFKRDEEGIQSLGDSGKEGDSRKIGRFGLGMKSVFHICDAFFWLASPHPLAAANSRSGNHKMINPWLDLASHRDWCEPTPHQWEATHQAVTRAAGELVNATWFCLWLPLRNPKLVSDGRGHFGYSDNKTLSELLDPANAERLACTLPLLRHVREIQVIGDSDDFELRLEGSHSPSPTMPAKRSILVRAGVETRTLTAVIAGEENQALGANFACNPHWPKREDDQGRSVPMPCEGRGISVVVGGLPQKIETATLDVQPAVFLLLDEGLGPVADITLVLHGSFFVNSGRQKLVLDSSTLEVDWNNAILNQVVFPEVPRTIFEFAETVAPDTSVKNKLLNHIVRLLHNKPDLDGKAKLVERRRGAVTSRFQLVPRMGHGWQLLSESDLLTSIDPGDSSARTFESTDVELRRLLPGFKRASDLWNLVSVHAPMICRNDPQSPTPEIAEALLGSARDLSLAFEQSAGPLVGPLLRVLVEGGRFDLAVTYLREIIAAWSERSPTAQKEDKPAVQHVVALLPSTHRLNVQVDLPPHLLRFPLPCLLVPRNLRDEAKAAPVRLESDVAEEFLTVASAPTTLEPIVLSKLAKTVMSCVEKVGPRLARMPLFRVSSMSEVSPFLSIDDLRSAAANGLLFAGGDDWVAALRAATEQDMIACSDLPNHPDFKEVVACNVQIAAELTRSSHNLAPPAQRLDLLKRFRNVNDLLHREAIRTLLAGHPVADDETLFRSTAGVWAEILKHVESGTDEKSVFVDSLLVDEFSESLLLALNVHPTDANAILSRLGSKGPENLSGVRFPELLAASAAEEWQSFTDDLLETHRGTLRALSIHLTDRGERIACDDRTFVDAERAIAGELPPAIRYDLKLVQPLKNERARIAQRQLIDDLDPEAALRLIVNVAETTGEPPETKLILKLMRSKKELASDLLERIAVISWVPTFGGRQAPRNVLRLPFPAREWTNETETSEVEIDESVKGDIQLLRKLMPNVDESIERLGAAAGRQDRFRVGISVSSQADGACVSLEAWRAVFGDESAEVMPSARLVATIASAKLANDSERENWILAVLKSLSLPIKDSSRLSSVLRYLSKRAEKASKAKYERDVFWAYLREATNHSLWRQELLPGLRLPVSDGTFNVAEQICVSTPGVSARHRLAKELEDTLKSCVATGFDSNVLEASPNDVAQLDLDKSAGVLREYLERFACPPGARGALVALLGDEHNITELASEYLRPRTLSGARELIPFSVVSTSTGPSDKLEQLAANVRIAITIVEPDVIATVNLLGDAVRLPPNDCPDTLLVGHPTPFNIQAGEFKDKKGWHLQLRRIAGQTLSPTTASKLLQQTAAEILNFVYWQWNFDLSDAWEELAQSDQIDVEVGAKVILDQADGYLRRMGSTNLELFRESLKELDRSRDQIAEAERMGKNGICQLEGASARYEAARQEIARLLEVDPEAQTQVLAAMRSKVREFQYDERSIPLELFQNADDAAVEWAQMVWKSGLAMPACDRTELPKLFVASSDSGALRFAHWGRPINKFRYGMFNGEDLGYRGDLRKMLSLSESDKFSGVNVSLGSPKARTTTGRFGLGFKSVFLICDRPRVVSGWLAFEVRGGLLPVRLQDDEPKRLRDAAAEMWQLCESSEAPPNPTLIELVPSLAQSDCVRFAELARLAPALVIFAKQLRRIGIRNEGAATQELFTWSPVLFSEVEGMEVGCFGAASKPASGLAAIPQSAAFFSGPSREGILIGLSSEGPVRLCDLPDVWVTAPIIRELKTGVAVNGPFAVDPGRTQLRVESAENHEIATRISKRFGKQLVDLFDATTNNWSVMSARLGLKDEISLEMFWGRMFELLTPDLSKDSPEASVMQKSLAGLEMLVHEREALPADLTPTSRLLKLGQVKAVLKGILSDDSNVRNAARTWSAWRIRNGEAAIVQTVHQRLSQLGIRFGSNELTLADLVSEELGSTASASSASLVSNLLMPLLRGEPKENRGPQIHDGERKSIESRLKEIQFLGDDNCAHAARDLLLPARAEEADDEQLRAAFAPAGTVLSNHYDAAAIALFRYARKLGGVEIGPAAMVEWAITANVDSAKSGVLKYLAIGEHHSKLAERLRDDSRFTGCWLASLCRDTPFFVAAVESSADRLRVLANLGLIDRYLMPQSLAFEERAPVPLPEPGEFLRSLAKRWKSERSRLVSNYDRRIYGGRPPALDLDCLHDPHHREACIELFVLGALHSTPFGNLGSWGNFVSQCRRRGWLEVFAGSPPDNDRWMDVLRQYVRDELGYSLEMRSFPGIYQLSLHLDDYVEVIREAAKLEKPTEADLFDPRQSAQLSGSGIGDAPRLERAAKMGKHFIIRELVRRHALGGEGLFPHCYVPLKRVRLLVNGWGGDQTSAGIYAFLAEHLEDPTFDGDFDLPLLAVAEKEIDGLDSEALGYLAEQERQTELAELQSEVQDDTDA